MFSQAMFRANLLSLVSIATVTLGTRATIAQDARPDTLTPGLMPAMAEAEEQRILGDLSRAYNVLQWTRLENGQYYGRSSGRIGRSSRPTVGGPSTTFQDTLRGVPATIEQRFPVPDLFVTEAPFVETNLRFDFIHSSVSG